MPARCLVSLAVSLAATRPVVATLGVRTEAVAGRGRVAARRCLAAAAAWRAGAAAYGFEVTHSLFLFREFAGLRELDARVMRASHSAQRLRYIHRRHQVDDVAACEAGEIALAVDDHATATAQAPRPRRGHLTSHVDLAHLVRLRIGSMVAIGTTFLRGAIKRQRHAAVQRSSAYRTGRNRRMLAE